MIWLTWRQFRTQAITAAAALAAFVILLAASESHLSSLYDSSGLLTCHGGACSGLASQFLQQLSSGGGGFLLPGSAYMILYFLSVLVILITPAIMGGAASIFSEGRFGWFVFPTHGITPLGYAASGFALGVTAGLLTRRPVPAMAITLAVFAAVQFITPLWIRPNLSSRPARRPPP